MTGPTTYLLYSRIIVTLPNLDIRSYKYKKYKPT